MIFINEIVRNIIFMLNIFSRGLKVSAHQAEQVSIKADEVSIK